MNARGTYDVIIVGAGPGGLECAYRLKDSHLSVLVLEKSPRIGPKVCAGGVTETEQIVDVPDEMTCLYEKRNRQCHDQREGCCAEYSRSRPAHEGR